MTFLRSQRCRRTLGAALSVVALAGCGADLHPGTAAVVNDTRITQSEVDDLTLAFCEFIRIQRVQQGQPEPTTSIAQVRTFLTDSLIRFELDAAAAEKLGLEVTESDVAKVTQQIRIPESLQGEDRELMVEYFEDAGRSQAQHQLIGANSTDPQVTSLDQVTSDTSRAADAYVKKFAATQDIEVNPGYGTWDAASLTGGSGSLSSAVSAGSKAFVKIASELPSGEAPDVPASQLCG